MILKTLGIGILTVIAYLVLKPQKPEIALIIAIGGGVLISILILDILKDYLSTISKLINASNIPTEMIKLLLKIIGIGYLTDFGASIAEDAGCKSIASKITFSGKIIIASLAVPIISSVIELIVSLI